MGKSKVVVIKCESYNQEEVTNAIEKGMEILGGVKRYFSEDEEILLKPNLLSKSSPEKCVTTHPAVFRGVIELLKKNGISKIGYGDSPGNPVGGVEKIAEGSGLKEVALEQGIKLENFTEGISVEYAQGKYVNNFILCKAVTENKSIINLCKMKTHQLEKITGAVKNTFGCVYGMNKMAFHAKCPDANSFGKMLADLNNLIKPKLHIMDGVMAMEGNGPQSGSPIPMNVILFSEDPVALDTVFCKIINLEPSLVPTNVYGEECGVGNMSMDLIDIYNEEGIISEKELLNNYENAKYDVYRGSSEDTNLKMLKGISPLFKKRPFIISKKCVACGICVESCPIGQKALKFPEIKIGKKVPKYNYKNCIRCYCCQEMCPKKAIEVKTPYITKLLDRKWNL